MGLIIIPGQPEPDHPGNPSLAGEDLTAYLDEPDVRGSAERTQTLSYEDLERLTRQQVEANRGTRRDSPTQAAVDRAAEAAVEEGFIHVASALLMLSAHCVAGVPHIANQVLMQSLEDLCSACGGEAAAVTPSASTL